jgi:hypothetical protein
MVRVGAFQKSSSCILRDASRSLSSGTHSRDPLGMLLGEAVIARSEATKQSNFLVAGNLDCFAALAMTIFNRSE